MLKTGNMIILVLFLCCMIQGLVTAETSLNSTGSLQISSTPGSAVVYLDGGYKGITPEPKAFLTLTNLTPKSYTLELKKTDYQDYISTVQIVAGQTVVVSANMFPSGGPVVNEVNTAGIFIVILLVFLIIGFLVLYIRRRRNKPEPKKIELD